MFLISPANYSKQKITDNQTAPSEAVIYGDDKMIPNKWGQGQLFAFSALDGDSFFTDDFTGTLSGDKIGVIFHTKKRRTLFFSETEKLSPKFSCVASDIILIDTLAGECGMIFAERHLVTGKNAAECGVFVSVDGEHETIRKGDIEIHNTFDGEYTAIIRKNN